ncbi:hypothetical protein FGG78_21770 [Thioclava sp. BHET1]|nr:hypothetical protein FGG78_21770 [Thioclava sp. BHET1]
MFKSLSRSRAFLLALVAGASLSVFATGAKADGEFFQLDGSSKAVTGVLTVERGRLAFSAVRSQYEGGHNLVLSVTGKGTVGAGSSFPVTLRFGPNAELKDGDWSYGAQFSMENYTPTSFGSLYTLASYSSNHGTYFAMEQFTWAAPRLTLEVSAQGDHDGYHENVVALSHRLKGTKFSLRAGYKIRASEFFAGFSINTF